MNGFAPQWFLATAPFGIGHTSKYRYSSTMLELKFYGLCAVRTNRVENQTGLRIEDILKIEIYFKVFGNRGCDNLTEADPTSPPKGGRRRTSAADTAAIVSLV